MTKTRKGTWGKSDNYDKLPATVQKCVNEIQRPDCEHTWTVFVDKPHGQLWMVCKTYATDIEYTVYASKIVYEKQVSGSPKE